MKYTSLATKLIFVNLIIVALAVIVTGLLHTSMLREYAFEQKERELIAGAHQIESAAAEYLGGDIASETMEYVLTAIDQVLDARVHLVDTRGLVVLGSRGERGRRQRGIHDDENLRRLSEGETIAYRTEHPEFDEQMLTAAVPIFRNGHQVAGALIFNSPVSEIYATIHRLIRFVMISGALALGLAAFIGYLSFRRIVRPITEMTEVAMEMAGGDFERRAPVESKDEVGQLGNTLNYLSRNLSETINYLRGERDKFASTVAAMSDGLVGINEDGEIFVINSAASRLLDLPYEGELSEPKNYRQMPISGKLKQFIEESLTTGESRQATLHLAQDLALQLHINPVRTEEAKPRGFVLLLRDVSEAERLERMRRQFIADASHELRSPLTVITGYLEAMHDGTIDPQNAEKYISYMRSEALQMNRLIKNLLDLERYDSGQLEPSIRSFDLCQLIETVVERIMPLAKDKDIQLQVKCKDDFPSAIADPDLIEQVLINLLDNSVRHTGSGGKITIATKLHNCTKLHVSVADNGEGIPKEELEHLWERFYKVDRARKRGDDNTAGLGLAIVKRFIDAHDQKIWIDSEYGVGTTVTFTLQMESS